MIRVLCAGLFAAACAFVAACEKKPAATEFKGHDHDHSDHDRKDAMIEDLELPNGLKCHVGLTAHLSEKDGNELEVFFETTDQEPKALPIPMKAKVLARVTRASDNDPKDLEFKPAEKNERKGDPDDKCSRFSADAKWMKPDDNLEVVLTIIVDGKIKKTTFSKFVPKEKAHEQK